MTGASASSRPGGASLSHAASPAWHSRSSQAWAVVLKPGGQQAALPGGSRRLESLQLLQRAGQSRLAHQLSAGSHVLPPKEKTHEVLGGHRLDRLPARPPGVGVHTGQKAPSYPFGTVGIRGVAVLEGESLLA